MMRCLAPAVLGTGIVVGLFLGHASASPRGGFPDGARVHGYRAPPVPQHLDKADAAKPVSPLPGPLDYSDAIPEMPTRAFAYPFLNPTRCEDGARRSCATANPSKNEHVTEPAQTIFSERPGQ
jgi:hypothetical protein